MKEKKYLSNQVCQGQTLIEFSLFCILIAFIFIKGFQICWASWKRFQCIYSVFYVTHEQLRGCPILIKTPFQVYTHTMDSFIEGSSYCQDISIGEKIRLPKLQHAVWE